MWQRWNSSTHIFEKSSDNGGAWTPLGLSADIITEGALAKARQHSETPYKDVANTFITGQIIGNLLISEVQSIPRATGYLANLVDTGVLVLGTNAIQGFLFALNVTDGHYALFALHGGLNDTTELMDTHGDFTKTVGTASSINIYWSSGNTRYELQNNTGVTKDIRLLMIGI